eukprot:GFUD01012081.1.p1 GENE.GFUD01012081.1~~GFUD01012081.1.p1  ORF type:complete len:209 (-),score=43.88 GFUD01012081.1:119-709(-)
MALSKLFSLARRYPLVPSMLTYSVLYPSANVVQQVYFRDTYKQTGIDWKEVSRFLIYGGLFHAPLVFNWLRLAARLFPKDTIKHLAAKVFMDQACFAPMALSAFYIGLSTLEGKDKEGIYKEWRDKFPNTWATGVCIWTFLTAINFKFVPSRLRTVYVGVCGFFWFTFLAYLKSSETPWQSPVLRLVNHLSTKSFS